MALLRMLRLPSSRATLLRASHGHIAHKRCTRPYLRHMPTVHNRAELLQALQANATQIQGYGVARLGVFGSFARDAATPQSDVDLFIEFAPERKTLKNLVGLSRFLESQLGRKVELVTPASLNAFIGKHILQEVRYVALAA